MSGPTSLTGVFGDGVHAFKLPLAQLEELQDKTGVGPAALLGRLVDGSWRVRDLSETIRLSLIGGGMAAADAFTFVGRYVDGQPLETSLGVAVSVLVATLSGRKADEGNGAAARSASDPAPAGSTSPRSDDRPPSSASGRPSSKGSRSTSSKRRSRRGTPRTPKATS